MRDRLTAAGFRAPPTARPARTARTARTNRNRTKPGWQAFKASVRPHTDPTWGAGLVATCPWCGREFWEDPAAHRGRGLPYGWLLSLNARFRAHRHDTHPDREGPPA